MFVAGVVTWQPSSSSQGLMCCCGACRHLDLSGNKLTSVESLSSLPALHTLLLPGNCVASLSDCSEAAFTSLEVLDLSFNALLSDCIPLLGQWPQLRQLDVSGAFC